MCLQGFQDHSLHSASGLCDLRLSSQAPWTVNEKYDAALMFIWFSRGFRIQALLLNGQLYSLSGMKQFLLLSLL